MKKYRILPWILIFSGTILVSAITSYVIYTSGLFDKKTPESRIPAGTILQSALSLTPDQSGKVEKINADYSTLTQPVMVAIREKKSELLEELSKDNTDTARLSQIANELSDHQRKIQKANIRQFLELKKVCTPDQTRKLSQIYAEIYGCKGNGKGHGKGNGNGQGMRHRHRYGQQGNRPTE